jgi:hypothetical protein
MQALYYDRDANPVSQEQWQRLGCQPGYSRVAYADGIRHGRQVTVITFWSGLAADGGPDGPLIFCTCAGIRGLTDRSAAYQRRWGWPTLEAARAGHEAVTAWIARVAAFLAGATSQLPAPDPPGRQALTGLPGALPRTCPGRQARRSTAQPVLPREDLSATPPVSTPPVLALPTARRGTQQTAAPRPISAPGHSRP